MAQQTSTLQVAGDIGNIGFFQRNGKSYARKKTSLNKKRIQSDAAFVRTRENMSEFGNAATGMKLLRDAIRPLLLAVKDGEAANRLHKTLSAVKNLDAVSARGQRTVYQGLQTAGGKLLLEGFDFNKTAQVGSVLYKEWHVDTSTGEITIDQVLPAQDVIFAQGATHVSFQGGWANVDFATGESDFSLTNAVTLPYGAPLTDVLLTPNVLPAGTGTEIFLLLVSFSQEVNGSQYLLKNGAHNALCIVAVV